MESREIRRRNLGTVVLSYIKQSSTLPQCRSLYQSGFPGETELIIIQRVCVLLGRNKFPPPFWALLAALRIRLT